MAETIKLELVTPSRKVLVGDFESVNAVSVIGEFGVLPGHAPMLALLSPGVVTATKNGKTKFIAVKSGVAEVEPERIIIMTEEAEEGEKIDLEEAKKILEEAQKQFSVSISPTDSAEFKIMSENIEWLRARVNASSRANAQMCKSP